MSVNFTKLTPNTISSAAIVPQAMDNQWVPRDILAEMIKNRKGLEDIRPRREKYILKEWRRALIYAEQVVVNRAFIFNNGIIVDDYDDAENRQHFKDLLDAKVIVPYLYTEDTPDQKPVFQIEDHLWDSWMDIVKDTKMSCLRLNWGDQRDEFNNLSRKFHDYIQRLGGNSQTEQLASFFSVRDTDLKLFQSKLKSVARFAYDKLLESDRPVTRNDLYGKFIAAPGTSTPEGKYSTEPFVSELKQIIDLKYNVNLPDALGCNLLTPQGSPSRAILGDLDDAINSAQIDNKNIQDILSTFRKITFENIASSLVLKNLDELSLADVVKIRASEQMQAYRESLKKTIDGPLGFLDESTNFLTRYRQVNEELTRIRYQGKLAKWEPWIKFVISVGANSMELLINPNDPSQKYLSKASLGPISKGTTPFLISLAADTLTKTDSDLSFSTDLMRGTIENGRDTWEELVGQIQSLPGVKENPSE